MFSYGVKKFIMEHLTLFYINNVNCFEKKNLKIHLHTNVWPSSRSQPAPFSCCVFIPDLTFDLSLCAFVHDLQRRKKHKQNTFLLRSLKPFSHISEPLFTQGNHEAFWVTPPPPPSLHHIHTCTFTPVPAVTPSPTLTLVHRKCWRCFQWSRINHRNQTDQHHINSSPRFIQKKRHLRSFIIF